VGRYPLSQRPTEPISPAFHQRGAVSAQSASRRAGRPVSAESVLLSLSARHSINGGRPVSAESASY
jgi:hypothetical protein